jgi:preprotein translocase subunit SecD
LTPEAGQRLLRLTSENLGQLVAMTLDGETLMEARINGTFGEQFQIAGQQLDPDLDVALAVILTTGALPADVRAVSSP